jgi:hypothetical protein
MDIMDSLIQKGIYIPPTKDGQVRMSSFIILDLLVLNNIARIDEVAVPKAKNKSGKRERPG